MSTTWVAPNIPNASSASIVIFSLTTSWVTPTQSVIGRLAFSQTLSDLIWFHDSSRLSSECADGARKMVLSFFQAPRGYTVIFTANATGALKLVGEAFPFQEDSSFVLGADSHNSVHGIREFAARRGTGVHYIASTPTGGFEPSVAKVR